tara:strand:+ start:5752 stop:6162 length:411 start_codon:yes stop_codon:yes gene_type:complete
VDVDPISSDDEEINAAMDHARDTFADFVATSQDTETEGTGFLAKVRIGEGDVFEDLWVNGIKAEEDGFSGIVNEAPMKLQKVEALEEVRFTENQIVDWQYFADGKIVGAFTTRVERGRMTEEERTEHDELYPFPFD